MHKSGNIGGEDRDAVKFGTRPRYQLKTAEKTGKFSEPRQEPTTSAHSTYCLYYSQELMYIEDFISGKELMMHEFALFALLPF